MRQQSYSAFVTRFLVLTSFLSSSPPSLLLAMAICSLMSSLFFLLSSASASSRLMASASCSCSSSSPWVWGLETATNVISSSRETLEIRGKLGTPASEFNKIKFGKLVFSNYSTTYLYSMLPQFQNFYCNFQAQFQNLFW